MNLTSQRYQRAVGIITVTVTIVLVANMNAIIDLFLHPDIEYFDIEHIIVGSATGIVVGIILFVLWSNIELSKNVFGNFKYSKKALAESETRYQLLAENISDVIWIMDLEIKRFRYISPSIFRLRGLTVEEAMEERFEDSLTDLSLEYINSTISDRIQQFLKEGAQSYTDVVEQKCKDGSTVWVEIKTRFGMNKENGHIEVYGVSRNISERKKIETALRLSEDKFSKAFYTSPDAINITRLSDGRYLDVNAGFTAMSGYTPEEVINKTSLELNIWNDPNDRARLVRELREKGEVSNLEAVFTLKNDRKITGLMSARIIEINGETCLLSITRDITERKKNEEALRESEKRIRTLIEQAPIGIATSRDGITLTANQVYLKMFGFEEVDELVGKSLIEQIAPQCRQEISDRVRQRALGENVESNYETIGLRKDGTEFPFLVSVSRVMLSDGPLTISFFTDITEQKKYEDTLYHTNTYLQSLINSNTRYVVRTDINGNYTYVNEPFFKKFGFTADDIIGKSATLTVLADDHEKMRMTAVKCIENPGVPFQVELRKPNPDGGIFYTEWEFILISDAEGKPEAVQCVGHDITARKKAEDALHDSEIHLQHAEQFARFGYWQFSLGEKIMRASDSAVILYGFNHNEVPLSEVQAVVLPEYRSLLDKSLRDLIEQNKLYDVEFKIRRVSDGGIVDIHSKAEYNAQTSTVFGIVQDITERKKVEEALRESEEIFNQLMEHSPIYVFFKDQNIRSTRLSRNFEQMIGRPMNELLGKNMVELFPSDFAKKIVEDDIRILNEGKKIEVEEELNGRSYLTIKFPINIKEKPRYLAGFTIDITERKKSEDALRESEKRFRKILHDVQTVAVQGYAPDGTTQYWNQASELLYGYTAEEAIGRNLLDLIIPPEMRSGVEQAMKMMAETGQPIPASELSLMRKDGTRVSVFSSHTIVQIPGRPQELFCIDIDLSERKRSEEALRNAQKLESIGTLAGGIAHDFNNLLGAMMGNISLAQSRISPDHPAVKNIERAISAMERAATLTKQMLAYSGKGKFQIREIDLCALVQEHINLFEITLPKNVQLVSKLSHTPVFIKGDPGQIEQIVMNLIINGGEAIGKKQGTVLIEISSVAMEKDALAAYGVLTNTTLKEGNYALLTVTDNGSGMSKETIEKIFDPFFTTKFVGRGLGLSAVLGIIRGNEGGISIESMVGKGTTFKVLLPLIQHSGPERTLLDTENQSPILQNIKILVIDDEQYVLEMAVDILEFSNYKLLSAADPEKGITIFQEQWQSIDMVILDYSMPKMNGKEVFVELRKINPDVKVIISSGYTEEEIFELMGDDTPSSFIQKPYTQGNLLSVVKRILESA